MLRRILPKDARLSGDRVLTPETLRRARRIVETIRDAGLSALKEFASRYDNWAEQEPLFFHRDDIKKASSEMSSATIRLLRRAAKRIRRFAQAQRSCLLDCHASVNGGTAGHRFVPLRSAGCYVPAGRFPLVSSLLMTVITARQAGVQQIWVATPRPRLAMLAAAWIAGADGVLNAGGAHAIASLAYGVGDLPPADIVVGPGNRWVTAAKYLVSIDRKIDMLAGPSELLVIADEHADPAWVAADLLAQAEHDQDACPLLIATSDQVVKQVNEQIRQQLTKIDTTASIALQALSNGFSTVVDDLEQAVELANHLAPEHVAWHAKTKTRLLNKIRYCGCLFRNPQSPEVLGDYGIGPNHVLPTGGTARYASGLSVMTFLRTQTWLEITDADAAHSILDDSRKLADLEGLPGHAKSAQFRLFTKAARTKKASQNERSDLPNTGG